MKVLLSSVPPPSATGVEALLVRARSTLSVLLFALVASHAVAQVVNFNFMEDYNSTNVNFGQGAVSDPGHNFWNRVGPNSGVHPQNGANFFTSDGVTATSIRISFAGDNFGTGGTPLFAQDLFQGYYYTGTDGASFTITGLTAGQSYDFYFLSESGANDGNRAGTFSLLDGATVLGTAGVTATLETSFVAGVNFAKLSATPFGTMLSGTFAGVTGESNFAGLQVVAGVSAVPEPSTYAAICGVIAFVGAFIWRRRLSIGPDHLGGASHQTPASCCGD